MADSSLPNICLPKTFIHLKTSPPFVISTALPQPLAPACNDWSHCIQMFYTWTTSLIDTFLVVQQLSQHLIVGACTLLSKPYVCLAPSSFLTHGTQVCIQQILSCIPYALPIVFVTNFIWPYLHQFFDDSHSINGTQKPLKKPFN